MATVVCQICGKQYTKNEYGKNLARVLSRDSEQLICFSCALDKLTAGNPPEEGDINSALIISGEMTETDWKILQENLRSVEEHRSPNYDHIFNPYEDYDDPAWCYECNHDTAFCTCIYCPECGEYREDCTCYDD